MRAQIDVKLANLIRTLWTHGIRTTYCCQGVSPPKNDLPWGGYRGSWAFVGCEDAREFEALLRLICDGMHTGDPLTRRAVGLPPGPAWRYSVGMGARHDCALEGKVKIEFCYHMYFPLRDADAFAQTVSDRGAFRSDEPVAHRSDT